jgi:hypothetical protein
MTRTLGREEETKNAIAQIYTGDIQFADDLDCFAVRSHHADASTGS